MVENGESSITLGQLIKRVSDSPNENLKNLLTRVAKQNGSSIPVAPEVAEKIWKFGREKSLNEKERARIFGEITYREGRGVNHCSAAFGGRGNKEGCPKKGRWI